MLRQVPRIRLTAVATAMLTVVSVGFLAPAQSASAATYQTITGAGSTWAQNAISTWISAIAQTGLQVNYAAVGSTAVRAGFRNGTVNFAASEIPYGVQDGTSFDPPPTRGYAYVPDVAGGLAFMYNLTIGGQRVTNPDPVRGPRWPLHQHADPDRQSRGSLAKRPVVTARPGSGSQCSQGAPDWRSSRSAERSTASRTERVIA